MLGLCALSCADPAEPAPQPANSKPDPAVAARDWPADGVVAMDDAVLTLQDVAQAAAWVALIDPGKVEASHQRKAMVSTLLERTALADEFASERLAAKARADAFYQAARSSNPTAPTGEATGTWSTLGLLSWGHGLDAPLNEWLPPFEERGYWVVQRVLDRQTGTAPGATRLTLELSQFDYVPKGFSRADLTQILANTQLTVINPTIGDLIPASWRYSVTQGH